MGDVTGDFHDGGKEEYERVHEWEAGLPNSDDLTPLTQRLIPPELLSAFNIRPEPYRTFGDVSRASRDTLHSIHGSNYDEVVTVAEADEEIDSEEEEEEAGESESKKARRNESLEEADSATAAAKALKRPRLVWTPQLHKRFVDVVAHLGIKNAVPKTIMQLMNVDGLTRENVASHLQKYRLYLKRMQGVSFDGPANSSDHLFANSPAPASLPENRHGHGHSGMPIPMPIMPMPMPMPMPVMGTGHHGHMGTGMGLGMSMGNYNHHGSNQISHHHYQNHYLHYQYNGMMNYHQHYPSHVGDK